MRPVEGGFDGRSPVARESSLARTGDGRDSPCVRVNAPDNGIEHLDEVHVALIVEPHFVGIAQSGIASRSAIPRVSDLPGASDCRDLSGIHIDPSHAVGVDFTDVQGPVRAECQAVGVSYSRLNRGTAIAGRPGLARAGDSLHDRSPQGGQDENCR